MSERVDADLVESEAQRCSGIDDPERGLFRRNLECIVDSVNVEGRLTPLGEALDREMRGDPGTRYYSGSFDLAPGELLEVEIPFIACDYWMIQATNHWLEPIAGAHRNDATARADPDGRLVPCCTARSAPTGRQSRLRGVWPAV